MQNRHVRQQLISIQALGKNAQWPGTNNFFAFGTTLAFQVAYDLVHFVVPHKVLSSLLWTTRSYEMFFLDYFGRICYNSVLGHFCW